MPNESTDQIFSHGLDFLKRNRLTEASNAFRRAFKQDPENPQYLSYYGLIVSLVDDNFQDGINFCRAAIYRAAYEPQLYINLCRVYSKAGQRKKALEALVEGLNNAENHDPLRMEMKRMGVRRKPTIRFLDRDHILNKAIGRFTYNLRKVRAHPRDNQ